MGPANGDGTCPGATAQLREGEAREAEQRCWSREDDLVAMARHACDIEVHRQELAPSGREQEVRREGKVTRTIRDRWQKEDQQSTEAHETARQNILPVHCTRRWRRKVQKWPKVFYLAAPAMSPDQRAQHPGPDNRFLCRTACLRCAETHPGKCCCRQEWSPRATRVRERLEEEYECKRLDKEDDELRGQTAADRGRRDRVLQEEVRSGPPSETAHEPGAATSL